LVPVFCSTRRELFQLAGKVPRWGIYDRYEQENFSRKERSNGWRLRATGFPDVVGQLFVPVAAKGCTVKKGALVRPVSPAEKES
jgi:hypothetical protein